MREEGRLEPPEPDLEGRDSPALPLSGPGSPWPLSKRPANLLTQADDGNLPRGGAPGPHKDPGDQEEGIVRVELGELSVAPVVFLHAGAMQQRDRQSVVPDLRPERRRERDVGAQSPPGASLSPSPPPLPAPTGP